MIAAEVEDYVSSHIETIWLIRPQRIATNSSPCGSFRGARQAIIMGLTRTRLSSCDIFRSGGI